MKQCIIIHIILDERNAGYLFAFGPFADTSNEAPLALDPNVCFLLFATVGTFTRLINGYDYS